MDSSQDSITYSDYEEGDFARLAYSTLSPSRSKKTPIRPDHFTLWSDDEFHSRFRLLKSTVRFILALIDDRIEVLDDCGVQICAEHQLLFTLRYLATDTITATHREFVGIRRSTGKKIVEHVCEVLAFLRSRIIYLPKSAAEIAKVESEFFGIAKIPHCIGVVGCTHVRLAALNTAEKMETFRNQNDFYSLKVQIVCDANSKIENIVARWPGAAQEAAIFRNSKLCKLFEDGDMRENIIVGDCAYPLRKYLLTPIDKATSAGKLRYNEALLRTRGALNATCESWKRRFPILINGLAGSTEWIQCVVVATAVLHNIACNMGEKVPKITAEQEEKLKSSLVENSRFQVSENNLEHSSVRDFFVEYFNRFPDQKCDDKNSPT